MEEDTQATTTKALDAGTGEQPTEKKQQARRDRTGKRRTDDDAKDDDDSHGTTSTAKREQQQKATDATDQPSSKPKPRTQEPWQIQKAALKEKFPDGWQPRKRLSPDALAGIRALNAQFPDVYTTDALADKFQVSREAIRRILKSSWRPSVDEEEERQQRWFRRGKQVWEQKAALGIKPPQRWRMEGIARDPSYHEWSKKASQREREWEEEEVRKYRAYRDKMKKKAEGKKGSSSWR